MVKQFFSGWKSVTAKLFSTGNFALTISRNGLDNQVVWKSFDYPTDTILPGMKFGLDRRTGLNRFLTSSKLDDNGPREFSAPVDPFGLPHFFVYKNVVPYWRAAHGMVWPLVGCPLWLLDSKSSELDYSQEASLFTVYFVNDKNEVKF